MRAVVSTVAFLLLSGFLAGCDHGKFESVPVEPFQCDEQSWREARFDPTRFIAHAGGEIDGHRYTNSREALESSYARGLRLLEIDLIKTSDGYLVGAHDWDSWRESTGSGMPVPSHKEFKETRLDGKYTAMDLSDLDRWFAKHSDAYLITDKVDDFERLVEGFSHHDRLIAEVFSIEDYYRAQKVGIKYPMLSLWSVLLDSGEKVLTTFLRDEPVKFMAVSRKIVWRYKGLLRKLRRNDTCSYVFTSSDPEFLEAAFDNVIYGTYVDGWDLNKGDCTSVECDSY